MALTAAELVKADQEHLIHPLHHPTDNAEPTIYVRARGAPAPRGRRAARAGDGMQAVFLACGGAEANESAFKTARFYWKARGKPNKFKIIARQHGYHGVTLQAMSATGIAP